MRPEDFKDPVVKQMLLAHDTGVYQGGIWYKTKLISVDQILRLKRETIEPILYVISQRRDRAIRQWESDRNRLEEDEASYPSTFKLDSIDPNNQYVEDDVQSEVTERFLNTRSPDTTTGTQWKSDRKEIKTATEGRRKKPRHTPICWYWKKGYCKLKDKCQYRHSW